MEGNVQNSANDLANAKLDQAASTKILIKTINDLHCSMKEVVLKDAQIESLNRKIEELNSKVISLEDEALHLGREEETTPPESLI